MDPRPFILLLAFVCLLTATAVATAGERVYKRIGEDGVVEFTDVPDPKGNAEEVEIQEPQTYHSAPLPPVEPEAAPQVEPFRYRTLRIVSPSNDQAFPPGPGDVEVTVKVEPSLETRLRHRLELVVDGKPRPLEGNRTTLNNLDRGTHTVSVRVVDGTGKVVGESSAVTFHVQRPSILFPGRAPKPAPTPPPANP